MSRQTQSMSHGRPGQQTKSAGHVYSPDGNTHATSVRPTPQTSVVKDVFSQHVQTTGQKIYVTGQSQAAKSTVEYKWADSLIKLVKAIPDYNDKLKKNVLFQDALHAVNDKLFESKQTTAGQQTDYDQSREWAAKKQKYHEEIRQLKEHIQVLQNELHASKGVRGHADTSKYGTEIQRLRGENETLKSKLQYTQTEKDQLLHRLSKLAGAKLSDNNPDITDLSDPNRPQKLAQMYDEVYANVWTDAIDSMPTKNDKGNIRVLLDIFVEIWRYCENLGKHQLAAMENLILHPWVETLTPPKGSQSDTYHIEIMKSMKDARKVATKETRRRIFQHFIHENAQYGSHNKQVSQYAEACMGLCWLSAIQDPPIEFIYDVQEGTKMDDRYFKPYERSGQTVEYLVWPAMLLSNAGAVLSKGAVQVYKGKK